MTPSKTDLRKGDFQSQRVNPQNKGGHPNPNSAGIQIQVESLLQVCEPDSILGQKNNRKTALMRKLFTQLLFQPGSDIKDLAGSMGEKDILVLTLVDELIGRGFLERKGESGNIFLNPGMLKEKPIQQIDTEFPPELQSVLQHSGATLAKMILFWEKFWRGKARWRFSGTGRIQVIEEAGGQIIGEVGRAPDKFISGNLIRNTRQEERIRCECCFDSGIFEIVFMDSQDLLNLEVNSHPPCRIKCSTLSELTVVLSRLR